jgi:hypothetical protein
MACHHWISVLACAGTGASATATSRAQAPEADRIMVVVHGMSVLLVRMGSKSMPTPVTLPEANCGWVAGS